MPTDLHQVFWNTSERRKSTIVLALICGGIDMKYISCNPYEGARRAFLCLNPHATDADWEDWCEENVRRGIEDKAALVALASTCHACAAKIGDTLDSDVLRQICYAAGYFEALLIERFDDQQKAA